MMNTQAHHRPNTDPKYYKGRKLNKRLRSMHISVLVFLKQHNWKHAKRQKPVSADYQHERYCIITLMVLEQLPALGFEPTCLERLKPKHTRALVGLWDRDGLSPETIKKRLSILGWVCGILRKRDCMPEDVAALLEEPERLKIVTVAQKEKTFAAHGIDFVEVILDIARHDARVALIQLLKAAFGLRNKEAIRLKPHEACHGHYLLVTRGTKGGRARTVPYFDFESGLDPVEQEIVIWNLRGKHFPRCGHRARETPDRAGPLDDPKRLQGGPVLSVRAPRHGKVRSTHERPAGCDAACVSAHVPVVPGGDRQSGHTAAEPGDRAGR